VRNGDRWQILDASRGGSLQLVSLDGRGKVTVSPEYVQEHVALGYAVTVHKGQGVTTDHAVLVVDRATSTEHLYVGISRGRQHNLACVVTEPAGDEHQRKHQPTAAEVLAGALRKTSNERSATEVLREAVGRLPGAAASRDAILEGLRQSQAHTLEHLLRREATRQAFAQSRDTASPEPGVYRGVEL
jgi:hypothetical protein